MKKEKEVIRRNRKLKNVCVIKYLFEISDEYIQLLERRCLVIVKNSLYGYKIEII